MNIPDVTVERLRALREVAIIGEWSTFMKLYHGTTGRNAARIFKKGFLPRSTTGISHWSGYVVSHPDMVYFTDSFAVRYAFNSATTDGKAPDVPTRIAIIEVEADRLSQERLFPDEDYVIGLAVEHSRRKFEEEHPGLPVPDLTEDQRRELSERYRSELNTYHDLAGDSLAVSGVLAHDGPVNKRVVTRVAEFTFNEHIHAFIVSSVAAGRFYRKTFRAMNDFIFDESRGNVAFRAEVSSASAPTVFLSFSRDELQVRIYSR